MKIVKLNRRYKQFKEHGHKVALRFDSWDGTAIKYERTARNRLGGHGYDREATWFSYFGTRYKGPQPYWITFRNEADLTMIMLSATIS